MRANQFYGDGSRFDLAIPLISSEADFDAMDAFRPDLRSVSSPVGIILIIGLTLVGAVGIAVFGSVALQGAQDDSRIGQAEQSMVQFDSRAAQVALGDSQTQRVSLGSTSGGTYRVDEDAGQIRLYHEDWDGDDTPDEDNPEYISDWQNLGALVYEVGDKEIAYQGGGVWRKDDGGSSQMVSPPEFHYRQATLTLPIIRVSGSGSAAGNVNARTSQIQTGQEIFPDQDGNYPNGEPYRNPVDDGNMTVEIQSEYCEAWRQYLEERTDGEVTPCDEDDVVSANLITLGGQGPFDIVKGSTLTVRGQEEDDPLDEFELRFESGSESGFNNFGWTLSNDESDEKQFEIYLEGDGGTGDGDPVHMHLYYSEDGGDNYHSWVIERDDTNDDAFRVEGDGEDAVLVVDLLDASRNIEYKDFTEEDLAGGNAGPEFEGEGDFGDGDIDLGGLVLSDEQPLDEVVDHYFGLAGDLDLTIDERQQGNAGLDEGGSGGVIQYAGDGRVVTFLHVTENEVEVELGA